MRSLSVRVPALAMAVLAGSLLVAALVAHELVLAGGRETLDAGLEEERDRLALALETGLPADTTDAAAADRLLPVLAAHLARHPADDDLLPLALVGDEVLVGPGGPPALAALARRGALRPERTGVVETIQTAAGPARSLAVPVRFDGQEVATYQIVGSMVPVLRAADDTMNRLAVGSALALVGGGLLLTVTLRRALAPLRALARSARATDLEDLSSRVREPRRLDEVGVLAREHNAMLDRLREAARSRQAFLASVSHELRTPITIARGHVDVLEAGADPAAVAETAAVLRDELRRISRLVDDLMALGRSGTADFAVPATVSLVGWLDELRLRLTGLSLTAVEVHPAPPVSVVIDGDRLAQAVLNLVVNADVHTPRGTRIEVDATVDDGDLVVRVHDDGDGIDPGIRAHVLDPFVTAGAYRGSTGLGLAVVVAVVAAHGGDLDVASGPDGTTVTLTIPGAVVRVEPVVLAPR